MVIKKYIFPNWYSFLSYFAIALTLSLSYWQFQRGCFKRATLQQYQQQLQSPGLIINKLEDTNKLPNLSKICLHGTFDDRHSFFLDNQFYQHQIGYQVIMPFYLSEDQPYLLVNLGWIPQPLSRNTLPEPPKITGAHEICGYLKDNREKMLLLGDPELKSTWPLRIQRLWTPDLERLLPYKILHKILLLEPDNSLGFQREWKLINLTPMRHFSYAVQWLLISLSILVIYLYALKKK